MALPVLPTQEILPWQFALSKGRRLFKEGDVDPHRALLPGLFGDPPTAPPGVNLLELAAADDKRYLSVGPVVDMPGLRGDPRGAPLLGQHTREVLAELLGLSAAHLTELERQGAIATA